jgi:hypothetical protein
MPVGDLGDYDVQPVDHNPFGSMADSPNNYDVAPVDHDPFAPAYHAVYREPGGGREYITPKQSLDLTSAITDEQGKPLGATGSHVPPALPGVPPLITGLYRTLYPTPAETGELPPRYWPKQSTDRVGFDDGGGVTDLGEADDDTASQLATPASPLPAPVPDAPPPMTSKDVLARGGLGSISAASFSPSDTARQAVQMGLEGAGMSRGAAQDISGNFSTEAGALPVSGQLLSGADALYHAGRGEYGEAALSGVGAVPDVGPLAHGFGAMFLGPVARFADREGLGAAKTALQAGEHPYDVWSQHLWEQGPGQSWRTEITDPTDVQNWGQHGETKTIGDIYSHPELYKNYPGLEDTPVDFIGGKYLPPGAMGAYDEANDRFLMNADLPPEQRVHTVTHELQHNVQGREGWPGGADPEAMDVHSPGTPGNFALNYILKQTTDAQRKAMGRAAIVNEAKRFAYETKAGEAQAENPFARLQMNMPQRRAIFPATTEEVPRGNQWWTDPATGALQFGQDIPSRASGGRIGYADGGDPNQPDPNDAAGFSQLDQMVHGATQPAPVPAPAPNDPFMANARLRAQQESEAEQYRQAHQPAPAPAPAAPPTLTPEGQSVKAHYEGGMGKYPAQTQGPLDLLSSGLDWATEAAGRFGASTIAQPFPSVPFRTMSPESESLLARDLTSMAQDPGLGMESIPHAPEVPRAAEAPPRAVPREPPSGGGREIGVRPAPGAPAAADPISAERARATAAAGPHAPVAGLPQKPLTVGGEPFVPGPLAKAKDAAADYMRESGLSYRPPTDYAPINKGFSTRVAGAYDAMKHAPDDPAVKAAYDAMTRETMAQWQAVKKTGLKVDWIKPGMEDPYASNPRLAAKDVRDNNHWWGYPTDLGYGSTGEDIAQAENPLLRQSGEIIGGMPARINDVFRIVHDYFGHFKEGFGFRAEGEDNAFRHHAAMYSDEALPAVASETRGQNSWVNFGPHGEANRTAKGADTVFADQKIGIMPEWTRRDPGRMSWAIDRPADTTVWDPEARREFTAEPAPAAEDEVAATRMSQIPNIRDKSVEEGTRLAQQGTHLIEAPEGSDSYYLGAPPSIQSPEDLDALRRTNQEYLRGDPRGWDWYNRYRQGIHALSGGDPRVGDYMSAAFANWSPNRPPSFEFGAATKEGTGAMLGMPYRAGTGSQHQAFLRAMEQGDPNLMNLGEKTGEYANKINPRQIGAEPTATGVNDFRNARQWGFPFMRSADADTLTSAQHRWLDYENAGLVGWANENKIHGKNDWTGEQVQAAMWTRQKAEDLVRDKNIVGRLRAENLADVERARKANQPLPAILTQPQLEAQAYQEAFQAANTTAADSFQRHVTYAMREMQPGIPDHMPGSVGATQAERQEYFDYPGAQWTNQAGRDIIYGEARSPTGAGFHVLPSSNMRGIWYPEGATVPERNPGVAVPLFPGSMTGDPNLLAPTGRNLLEQGETLASYMGAQARGGAQRFVPGLSLNESNGYGFDLPRALTEDEQTALQAVSAAHGLPHVIDTGKGVRFTNFDGAPPLNAKTRAAFFNDVNEVKPQDAGPTIHGRIEGVSVPSEFTTPGSGDATRRLTKTLGQNWKSWNLWNNHPGLARVAHAFLARDLAWAERWGQPAEDYRNALKIIGDGPGWLDRLDQGRKYGLPAATAAGVALVPTAGLPASLPQKKPDEPPSSVKLGAQLRRRGRLSASAPLQ